MPPAPLEQLISRLWDDFTRINPQAEVIHQLLQERGETVVNDHVAFRTFDDPRVDISVIARPFLAGGYESSDQYRFEAKKLYAEHFEHPDPLAPKVFISYRREETAAHAGRLYDAMVARLAGRTESIQRVCESESCIQASEGRRTRHSVP
jgi:hypothetical protein